MFGASVIDSYHGDFGQRDYRNYTDSGIFMDIISKSQK